MTEKITVTKHQFEAFEKIREEGNYNMLDSMVQTLGGFSRDIHRAIISQYDELCVKYPGVRKDD